MRSDSLRAGQLPAPEALQTAGPDGRRRAATYTHFDRSLFGACRPSRPRAAGSHHVDLHAVRADNREHEGNLGVEHDADDACRSLYHSPAQNLTSPTATFQLLGDAVPGD